jgi:peptidoglycan/xylan/chitin deacetylase (PgdA/CDA1 family)
VKLIRSIAKPCALTLLAGFGWFRIKFSREPTLLILTYHRILPAEAPERAVEQPGMVTSPEALDMHVRLVKKLGAEPIHLNDWLEKSKKGQALPKLAVAYTFDDGWQDNYMYAYPRLKAQNTPATIFLVTQMVDTNETFWPEQVLKLLISQAIPPEDESFVWLHPYLPASIAGNEGRALSLIEADEVISRLKSMDDATILANLETLYQAHSNLASTETSRAILNASELREMSRDDLIRYGAHTRHHYRLNRLNNDQTLKEELIGCLDDLKALSSASVPIFCYPNGDITGKGETLVSEHYEAACTTKTGWNRAGCDPYDLHRFNLHDGNSFGSLKLLATIGRGLL